MGAFARSYQQLQTRMGKRQENAKSILQTKWAIRNREKFCSLLSELGIFVRYLDELLPTPESNQQRLVLEQICRLAQDMITIRVIQEALVRDP